VLGVAGRASPPEKNLLSVLETQWNTKKIYLTATTGWWYTRTMSTDIVDIEELHTVEYPELTVTEDTFCLAIIECGGNIQAAYKMTFGEDSPYPLSRGKELLGKPQVALRIKEITDKIQDASLISKGAHLYELADIRDIAKMSGQLKVALNAEVKRGEVVGFYDNIVRSTQQNNIQINFVSKFDQDI